LRTASKPTAHDAVLDALRLRRARRAFAHGAVYELPGDRWLVDSYHCSRYNTQTRRLTPAMFRAALAVAAAARSSAACVPAA